MPRSASSKSIVPHKSATTPSINSSVHSSQRPSFGQTMKEGFGLGVGVSVAQHAVNGVINFLTPPKSSNPDENAKFQEYAQNKNFETLKLASQVEYEKCMKYSSNDSELCKSLVEN